MKRLFPLAIGIAASLAACGDEEGACWDEAPVGVTMRFAAPEDLGRDFFAHPWPSDARRDPDGRLELTAFPNPTESTTLEDYLAVFSSEPSGFSKNAALYLSFTGALDVGSLPADPFASVAPESTIFLVDIDPSSPERGRRIPLKFRFETQPSLYLPADHLIVLPPYGLTLRDGTTYALLLTDGLRSASGEALVASTDFHNALRDGCADRVSTSLVEMLAPLRSFLEGSEVDQSRVVGATVFTTADVIQEMKRLAEAADALPAPEVSDLALGLEREDIRMITGVIQMPSFQTGHPPYTAMGEGAIDWGLDGTPVSTHTETTRVSFVLPKGRQMPPEGWPVVLYSHGTGGDHTDAADPRIADALARQGIASVGYDNVLHGPRDPTGAEPSITFFNLLNPIAGRDNFRQGGVDLVVMTNLIQKGVELPQELAGLGPVRFDPERIAFLGHSQGGLVGALYAAVEPDLKVSVFSGTAGVLVYTILERKDPVDFLALLRSILSLPDEETIDEMHPILALMQTFVDRADPVSYAPAYAHDPLGARRPDVLLIEGLLDYASPAHGHEALAASARAPVIAPVHRNPEASNFLGLDPQDAPARENVPTAVGPITMGLIQYPDQNHWPIYYDNDATARALEFLRSGLLDGRAVIIPKTR